MHNQGCAWCFRTQVKTKETMIFHQKAAPLGVKKPAHAGIFFCRTIKDDENLFIKQRKTKPKPSQQIVLFILFFIGCIGLIYRCVGVSNKGKTKGTK